MVDSFKSQGLSTLLPAPSIKDPDLMAVVQWVTNNFRELIPHLNQMGDLRLTELHVEPGKPRIAQIAWADGTDWNPGSGAGLYVFDGTEWDFLVKDVSLFMLTVLDDANAAAARSTLGLGPTDTFQAGLFYTFTVGMADDTATSFTVAGLGRAYAIVVGFSSGYSGIGYINTGASSAIVVGGANFAVSTGVLAGTTGLDNRVTISPHTDNKLYIENRSGFAVNFSITLAGIP